MGVPLIYQKIIYNISIIAFTYYCVHSIIVRNKKSKKSKAANMKESMIFPREEKTEILFQKILEDPWACEKLQETFCNSCLCGEETDEVFSPDQFSKALFTDYRNRDLSAFLMEICGIPCLIFCPSGLTASTGQIVFPSP